MAADVSLWQDKMDQWGGTKLDAAMNIILVDYSFANDKFQRAKFQSRSGPAQNSRQDNVRAANRLPFFQYSARISENAAVLSRAIEGGLR